MTRHSAPGVGWPLLPMPDDHGQLRWPDHEAQSVAQHLRVLLSTRRGELLGWADYGAGLDAFLHDHDALATRRRMQDTIMTQLNEWEPRIDVEHVHITPLEESETAQGMGTPQRLPLETSSARLLVEIAYRLVRTGAPGQLRLSLRPEDG